ncbi:piriformospora indica-insensitive protein 2 [Cucurbita pepo subsp. pepo]|uniref:piriformospora indica-insensitive protein 2 n=1 Tax=Cucurbita pepo subsp. pepo TaxID=3664 RepID=UPI000C9D3D29|nr:piriformospora indica-insensitive protein 2 [Cucurbita pepo subsp. pepo]
MAVLRRFLWLLLVFFITLLQCFSISHQQQLPVLSSVERDSVFAVLAAVNSAVPWRRFFPDDLCSAAPHGVVCDYFYEFPNSTEPDAVHITELSFGFISDYSANPPCSSNSTIDPVLFSSFRYLRKLVFYKCFTSDVAVYLSDGDSPAFAASLEELVLVDNPSLVVSLESLFANFTNIRRAIITGNGVYGEIPERISDSGELEEISLSRNRLTGQIPASLSKLKKLKILDLSRNFLDGYAPESIGNLSELLKLDLSSNRISGRVPESYRNLQKLEFLDLSFNRFGNFGIPKFLSEIPRLKEVHLSGNLLGGEIPEKWEKLKRLSTVGFSSMGLTGKIPPSMAVHLRSLNYLGLDGNNLEGTLPPEFEFLKTLNGLNVENNNLSGRVPFSANFCAKLEGKLRLRGNPDLCVDEELKNVKNGSVLGKIKLCQQSVITQQLFLSGCSSFMLDSVKLQSTLLMAVFWIFLLNFFGVFEG